MVELGNGVAAVLEPKCGKDAAKELARTGDKRRLLDIE